MSIHQLSLDDAFAALRTAPSGLSREQVVARRIEFGPNRIEQLPPTPLLVRLAAQFTHFFAGLLWLAALLAFVVDRQAPGSGMATLAIAIVCVIVVNGAFAFWQEYRAEGTMMALQRLLPHQVRTLRDGAVNVIPADDLVPGDVIFLSGGDNVPADCRLVEAFGVRVNTATINGEARPVSRNAGPGGARDVLQAATSCWRARQSPAGKRRHLSSPLGCKLPSDRSHT